MMYFLGMFSIGVFAITSVIATRHKDLDILSIVLLGIITALGGGTVRDIILGQYPIFWIRDIWYLWVAFAVSLISFFIVRSLSNRYRLLLYLDALGIALFSITAAARTIELGFPASIAILMGLITAIFGGIIRDTLTDSPSVLFSKELYATPVLFGVTVYVILNRWFPDVQFIIPLCIIITFVFRICAIRYQLQYPKWLHNRL